MQTGCETYLDYQASTPLDEAVFQEMLPYFTESFANPHSSAHASGWHADAAVQLSSERIAQLIGCDPDEIIFTSGATEANNLAILGLRKEYSGRRNGLITSRIEHKSLLAACNIASEEYGAQSIYCNVDNNGCLDLRHLEEIISEQTILISFGAVNSEIGTIQNIKELSQIAARYGALLHLDAAQMPVACDFSETASYADMISLSGHKIYGPKGIGCLYVRRCVQPTMAPLIHGGGQQNGLRSGTLPVPLCVGMGAASNLMIDFADERKSLRGKNARLWEGLKRLDHDVSLNGLPIEDRHPGNLNVNFHGFEAEDVLAALQPHVAASTGSACTSGTPEASHVLRAIGLSEDQARSCIRLSIGRMTTDDDIDRAVESIGSVLSRFQVEGLVAAI